MQSCTQARVRTSDWKSVQKNIQTCPTYPRPSFVGCAFKVCLSRDLGQNKQLVISLQDGLLRLARASASDSSRPSSAARAASFEVAVAVVAQGCLIEDRTTHSFPRQAIETEESRGGDFTCECSQAGTEDGGFLPTLWMVLLEGMFSTAD